MSESYAISFVANDSFSAFHAHNKWYSMNKGKSQLLESESTFTRCENIETKVINVEDQHTQHTTHKKTATAMVYIGNDS